MWIIPMACIFCGVFNARASAANRFASSGEAEITARPACWPVVVEGFPAES
jgi:hypothetical protein